jgi:hypothetical protein
MGIECIGGIIVMVWYHNKLDKKYLVWNYENYVTFSCHFRLYS